MRRALSFTVGVLLAMVPTANAVMCPVRMVAGKGDRDGISITFQNQTKLPIRRLEFRCTAASAGRHGSAGSCVERNALFYPGGEYTVSYVYPGGKPGMVTVSVAKVLLMDGFEWKPTKHDSCRALRISPPKSSPQTTRRNTK